MKKDQIITIIPSVQLSELKLDALAGRKAVLVEEDLMPKRLGWWVALIGDLYLNEREWFIPFNSIVL